MEKLEKIELYKNAVLFKGFASTNPNFTQEVDENRDYFMVKRNKGGAMRQFCIILKVRGVLDNGTLLNW